MVYIISQDGQPLMPTDRYGKVRRLLKSDKAKVIKRCPFTIQLLYNSTDYTQRISLGIDASFMGIMRWSFYDKLKTLYPNVNLTFGYITKSTRIKNNLPKEHYVDARCISGHPLAVSDGTYYYQKKVRCHNRQIHKNTILKGCVRKRNQAPYFVKGFRLFDKVMYEGQECFIFGRRSTGRMDLRLLDRTHINASVSYKKLKLIESRKNYITERRTAVHPIDKSMGFSA